jgi:hypothetical protein
VKRHGPRGIRRHVFREADADIVVGTDLDALMKKRDETIRWRREQRLADLRRFVEATANASWSPGLLSELLEELYVDESFLDLFGNPKKLPVRRYPQAVMVAVALRHSWRRDQLFRCARRLGVSLTKQSGRQRASRHLAAKK